jgi:filamentous hemagglutinin
MTVPYIFANAVGLVPASQLDVNFAYVSNNVSTANTVVANAQPTITSVGTLTSLSASGNIRGGNLLTAGTISATGTITTAGNLSLTGNIVDLGELWINTLSNGNINLNVNGTGNVNIPTGILSVTGNIQGGNLKTAGLISATANVTGGNLLTAGLVSATANVTGGNVKTVGLVSATGNVTGNNISATTAFQLSVYANTTTRDTAISSPTVGMLIVVGNTYQGYNGVSWGNITLT